LYGETSPKDHIWAAFLFGFAFWTDFFDGLLARRLKKITRLGKIMDPMADKLMVNTALVMLVYLGLVDVLVVILLIGREVAVNALRSLAGTEGIVIAPSLSGRSKVFAEGFGIAFVLLGPEITWFGIPWMELGRALLYFSLGLALWSAVIYFRDYYRGSIASDSAA
jgi:CDP-diacylglycerol---glycerol-3-phosphate 3-phosphatidyltransferase